MFFIDNQKAFERASNPEAVARKKAVQMLQILKIFSRGIYNSNNMIEHRFQHAILNGHSLQLISFWGVGEKKSPDKSDYLLLDEYKIIHDLIKGITLNEAEIIILLADTHGRFNGYQDFNNYHARIELEAKKRDLNPIKLDRLYEEWGINLPDVNRPVDEKLFKNFRELRQSSQLIESAKKHSRSGIEGKKENH